MITGVAERNRRWLSRRGETLVEVMVAAVVGLVISTGTFLLCGTLQSKTLQSLYATEALGMAQGRMQAILADLNKVRVPATPTDPDSEGYSPLYAALPKDFTVRYLKASGTPSAPWLLSTAQDAEAIALPELAGYKLQTSVVYFDDALDNSSPTDTEPYDGIQIVVRIVPATTGGPDAYSNVKLTSLWCCPPSSAPD
jgi:hypothetical protein